MNKQLLKDASTSLAPLKVLLSNSEVWSDDRLENADVMQSLEIETYNTTSQVIVDELSPKDGSSVKPLYVYKFYYDVAIRGVEAGEDQNDDEYSLQEKVEPIVLYEIKARFKAMYSSETQLGEDCINEFAKYNVGHGVWPYWREFVQSSCSRMGIDIVHIPFYKIE